MRSRIATRRPASSPPECHSRERPTSTPRRVAARAAPARLASRSRPRSVPGRCSALRDALIRASPGAHRAGHGRHGQDTRRRRRRGRPRHRVGRVRGWHPAPAQGRDAGGGRLGLDVEMVRQPVGVVAAITPFNFPAMIPLWFLPYAVACGNAFILKPSERDPRPSQRICELIDEAEIFPPGVVNLVHGGREAVESILDHHGRRRDLVRRPGQDRPADRHSLGRVRQAGAGSRWRQELDDRRRRRRPRE